MTRAGLESRIARNSAFLMAGEGLARVLNLVIAILLYRYLKPEGSGVMGFVISYGVLLGIVTEFGLTRAAVREIARAPRGEMPRAMGHIILIRAVLTVFTLAVIWGSLFTPLGRTIDTTTKWLIFMWSWSVAFQAFRRNSEIVFQALEQLHYQAFFLALNRIIASLLIVISVITGRGLCFIFAAYLIADFIDAVLAAWVVRARIERATFNVDRAKLAGLVRASVPFGLQLLAGQIYFYIDSVLIYYLYQGGSANSEIGFYRAAGQMVLTLQFIPISVCNALYAPFVKACRENRARLKSLFGHSYNLFALGGMVVTLFFFSFRSEFILLVFGERYRPTIGMFELLIWSLPMIFMTMPLSNLLAASDRQGVVTITACLTAVVNVVFNVLLIPRYGGLGAAIAMLATSAFALLTQFVYVAKHQKEIFDWPNLLGQTIFHAAAIALLTALDRHNVTFRVCVYVVYAIIVFYWGYLMMRRRREVSRAE